MTSFYKVLVVGDPGIGKSTLISCLTRVAPDATGLSLHPVFHAGKLMTLWDTPTHMYDKYKVDADAVIIVFDVTRYGSYMAAKRLFDATGCPVILVGNKADISDRKIPVSHISRIKCPYFEVSAVNGFNVTALFDHVSLLLERLSFQTGDLKLRK